MSEVEKFHRARLWALSRSGGRRPLTALRISRVRAKRLFIELEQLRLHPNLLNVERAMLEGKGRVYEIAISWPASA